MKQVMKSLSVIMPFSNNQYPNITYSSLYSTQNHVFSISFTL